MLGKMSIRKGLDEKGEFGGRIHGLETRGNDHRTCTRHDLGCRNPATYCTEHYVAQASHAVDFSMPPPVPQPPEQQVAEVAVLAEKPTTDEKERWREIKEGKRNPQAKDEPVSRFQIPDELPGAKAPPLKLPPFDPSQKPGDRRAIIERLFPELPPVDLASDGLVVVTDQPLSLAELQALAVNRSPVIRQAAADVEEARGNAVQAGLYPNPTVGYEGDTLGTAQTAGYNGVLFTQEIVTANKLSLAQCSLLMEVRAREHELQRRRIELASQVRRGYFRVLLAQEQLRLGVAVHQLAEDVYKAQIQLVSAGEAAPYEPLQLRVFAVQARNQVIRARNSLDAAWRQLAASVGDPSMPRHLLDGSIETPCPQVEYEVVAAYIQRCHTDIAAADARIASASYNLRLQQVTPIPNLNVYGAFQHDDTTPLSDFSTNVQVSIPVPVFDRNQGNISAANAQLVRAHQDLEATRNRLLGTLAETLNRYQTNQEIAVNYRNEILEDQCACIAVSMIGFAGSENRLTSRRSS